VDRQALRFDCYAITHPGRVRTLNEDRYLLAPRSGVWLVADGMGGHDAGEVASSAIVAHMETIGVASSAPDLRARFEDRITRANREIWDISQQRGRGTIGSTVAALLTFDRQFACLWMGDSRVYLVRAGMLSQVSRDHTEVQELLDRGVITENEAATWPRRNVITRAVGVSEEVHLDMQLGYLEAGDVFILASDGLTTHVGDDEIREAAVGREPHAVCDLLLGMVLERGATDNVTIIVVECRGSEGQVETDRTRVDTRRLDLTHGG
jgi:serine/threonine protein phosphatase PrpC